MRAASIKKFVITIKNLGKLISRSIFHSSLVILYPPKMDREVGKYFPAILRIITCHSKIEYYGDGWYDLDHPKRMIGLICLNFSSSMGTLKITSSPIFPMS